MYLHCIVLDPKEAKAYNNLGKVYADERRYEDAAKCYYKAIDLDPQDQDSIIYKNL